MSTSDPSIETMVKGVPLSVFLDTLRTTNPLVHCFANYVSMDIMANILLASGASPAMVHSNDECSEFTIISSGLSINIGTLDQPWINSMKISAKKAMEQGIPWVLDPVGCGATALRTETSYTLAKDYKPAAVRGNGGEMLSLYAYALGKNNSPGSSTDNTTVSNATKGVDSTIGSNKAIEAGIYLSKYITNGIIVISGDTDYVIASALTKYNPTANNIIIGITSGTPLLQKITATGCSLSSLVAAFLSIVPNVSSKITTQSKELLSILGAASACAYFGAAADTVIQNHPHTNIGPGTLRVQLIDQLYLLPSSTVDKVKVEVLSS